MAIIRGGEAVRDNTEVILLASAARIATTDSDDQTNHNSNYGAILVVNVSEITATPVLTPKLQLKDLARAAEVARKLRVFQREIDQLSMRLEIQVRRYEEVSMEVEEAKLFREQIESASNDRDQPAESDRSKD